jgi:hypothetical protein
VKGNEPVLEVVPDVIPAIAWPNWLAACVTDRTKVSDTLSECPSVAVTLIASAFVPSGIGPLKVAVAGSKCNQDGSGAPLERVAA